MFYSTEPRSVILTANNKNAYFATEFTMAVKSFIIQAPDIRLGWKGLRGTNSQAYYEHL
jgi:hypothetical protein